MRQKIIRVGTLIVGSGAAGLAAAWRLRGTSVAIVTEGMNMGTSRNTGSDKQTYYKLGMSGDIPDSPAEMAHDLFAGGCVDGDTAYAEAANSARCFLSLAELGVPFPTNLLGEYVGYRTDHDTRARATSAGPLTSKMMTECLERAVRSAGIPVYDNTLATEILRDTGGRVTGLAALRDGEPVFFRFDNLILATGGPAGIYEDSVYPESQCGATGLALAAGAHAQNLTEWQYGIASIAPRWNVSGTYMQVLPRVFSIAPDGSIHDFLSETFDDAYAMLSLLFRKGYEWPFDCRKASHGSSLIDLLVYYERSVLGRRVYLDYTRNPVENLDFSLLASDAREYLTSTGAAFGTPVERLRQMNEPAYQLYLSKGVDLEKEPLEIALCAQHNNGGISVDDHWQSTVPGLYVIGEAAGTHGIRRPGGSALNAGQVGALRAAEDILTKKEDATGDEPFYEEALRRLRAERTALLSRDGEPLEDLSRRIRKRMSACAGAIRNLEAIRVLASDIRELYDDFFTRVRVSVPGMINDAYRFRSSLLTSYAMLTAISDHLERGLSSRGSAIYLGSVTNFASLLGYEEDAGHADTIQEVFFRSDPLLCTAFTRPVRPLPIGGGVFENVWREYRQRFGL